MSVLIDSVTCLEMTGSAKEVESWSEKNPEEDLYLSIITADELMKGVEIASANSRPRRLAFLEALLNQVSVLPLDESVMRIHAKFYQSIRPHWSMQDAWLAATALAHGCRLLTSEPDRYRSFGGLEIERWPPEG